MVILNILGIDFEEWYHPQLVQPFIKNLKHEPKIIEGITKILELLRKTETNATFFMVGELLEFKPELLDLILENGHEISFHTMKHSNLNAFEGAIPQKHQLFSKNEKRPKNCSWSFIQHFSIAIFPFFI